MNYFSMFSGIGGFEKGIEQAYVAISSRQREQQRRLETTRGVTLHGKSLLESEPVCIGFSEIDKYAISIYQKHFPEHKNYGSATTINASELPDFDLLVGGFPCQSFSIAGKRGGFDDTRGTLFFDIARILATRKPRNFVLENVKGLLSHDNGRTFKTIITTLVELGYSVEWQVLNSKNFGVPQNRERVYIVGHLGGEPERKVFPIGETNGNIDEGNRKREKRYARTLDSWGGMNARGTHINASTQKTNAVEILRILQEKIGKKAFTEWGLRILNSFQEEEVLQPILHGKSLRRKTYQGKPSMDDSSLPRTEAMPESELLLLWESKNRCSPQEPRLARQYVGELSKSLSELPQQNPPFRIRRLTPLEAERLQGFPDGWTDIVSDTQRYKCCGNAVTVNVVQAVMEKIFTGIAIDRHV